MLNQVLNVWSNLAPNVFVAKHARKLGTLVPRGKHLL